MIDKSVNDNYIYSTLVDVFNDNYFSTHEVQDEGYTLIKKSFLIFIYRKNRNRYSLWGVSKAFL
jgi:hypothetical protein